LSLEHGPQRQGGAVYLTARQLRARYGVSEMSIWRWVRDPALAFPQPIYINRRRYWRLDLIERFDAARTEAA